MEKRGYIVGFWQRDSRTRSRCAFGCGGNDDLDRRGFSHDSSIIAEFRPDEFVPRVVCKDLNSYRSVCTMCASCCGACQRTRYP